MNFLVIGLGSMGKRRIRLLKKNLKFINIFGVETNKNRATEVQNEFGIEIFRNIADAIESVKFNAALVCTSPITHENIILECLNYDLNVFTEINLINSYYDKVLQESASKDLKVYLSSTFLKRKEIQFIRDKCFNQNITYRYHAGQYLPDWHPWESYKDYFVSNKLTNACREILAIELPWLICCFGEVEETKIFKTKISSLEIDYEDTYQILLKHRSGIIGNLTINVVSRVPKRDFEVIGEQCQLSWDGTPNGLYVFEHESKAMTQVELYASHEHLESYTKSIVEDAYLEELKEFVKYLTEDEFTPEYSFAQDYKVIEVINHLENQL